MISRRNFLALSAVALNVPMAAYAIDRGTWSENAGRRAFPLVTEMIQAPFIQGIVDGTLPKKAFVKYLAQDIWYLDQYENANLVLANRAKNKDEAKFFNKNAKATKAITDWVVKAFDKLSTEEEKQYLKPLPKTIEYSDFESRAARSGSYPVAAAALFPCVWVYARIGLWIETQPTVPNNPYQEWIDAYKDPESYKIAQEYEDILNKLAKRANQKIRGAMTESFLLACQFEQEFFAQTLTD